MTAMEATMEKVAQPQHAAQAAQPQPTEQVAQPQRAFAPTDEANFVSALSRTLAAANDCLLALLAEAGLRDLAPSHGDILMHLFTEEPVTMQRLAQAIHRDPSTVTALVRKLAQAGYVATCKSDADRRVTEVTLTEKGAALRPAFDAISRQLRDAQMRGVDPESFRTACAVLDCIRDNFACATDAGAPTQGGIA